VEDLAGKIICLSGLFFLGKYARNVPFFELRGFRLIWHQIARKYIAQVGLVGLNKDT
jgi:hypothetical protein